MKRRNSRVNSAACSERIRGRDRRRRRLDLLRALHGARAARAGPRLLRGGARKFGARGRLRHRARARQPLRPHARAAARGARRRRSSSSAPAAARSPRRSLQELELRVPHPRNQRGAARAPAARASATRVQFLDRAAASASAASMLANEVVDAMPVHAVAWRADGHPGARRGCQRRLAWEERPATGELLEAGREPSTSPPPYESEIGLAARGLDAQRSPRALEHGAIFVIDYGFPRHEYYHPQRATGTLMCHYRHRAHGDPFARPGEQDITAHVDFSALAARGARSRARGARLRDAGAVPRQLRHHRRAGARRTSRTRCTTRRSPPRRRSCSRPPRWASCSRCWRSGAA